jgi:hypothetical protein
MIMSKKEEILHEVQSGVIAMKNNLRTKVMNSTDSVNLQEAATQSSAIFEQLGDELLLGIFPVISTLPKPIAMEIGLEVKRQMEEARLAFVSDVNFRISFLNIQNKHSNWH